MFVLLVLVLLVFTLAFISYIEHRGLDFAKMKDGFVESGNSCSEIDYEYFDSKRHVVHSK